MVRKIRSWGGRVSGLKQYSGQLLGGTGWWLRASCSVNALAKEAEVQGNDPARAGTGVPVKKPGRSPGLERAVLSGAAQHSAFGPGERGGLGRRGKHRERQQYNSIVLATCSSEGWGNMQQGRVRLWTAEAEG